ncbi:MAG TPA: serine protease, partial [Actinoplanes sp.]|nr:serine protease [Actinoplanes sp.]
MTADGGPSAAIARLHDPAGAVLGAGFLVTSELVVTCAHVLSPGGGPPPDGPVRVDFPLAGATASAVVTGWTPIDDGDIAVLRLTAGVPGVRPARLTDARPRWGDPVRVFGFPADLPDLGVWAAAELRDRQAAGWLQVESTTPGRVIEPGFSGAPVWSPAVPGVIGMVVAADRGAGYDTGYLVPAPALVAAHPELGAPDPAEESPFRGLEPFRPEHAAQFRGRAVLTADVVALSGRQPLILLTGPSGGGKSSLLLAGVVPAVRRAGRAVAITRTLPDTSPSTLLAGLVLPVLDAAAEVDRLEATTRLAARLDAEPGDTVRWLAGRLTDRAPGGVLLVVDQLEEAGPATARTLIGLLHDLTDAAGRRAGGEPRVVAVATLRSGLVDDVVTEVTRRAVRAGWVPVPPMTADQLQAAATPDGVTFEPGLVRRLIDDAGDEPGRLPLLEFTLDRLWSLRQVGTLTHDAYDRIGGLSGAVAGYAGQVVDSLPAADRARARRLLTRLTRPGTGGDFERHPVRLADLDDELRPVLARLAASRLVVLGRTAAGDDIAELAHQALVRRWPLLRGWLAEDRDFRLWQEDLRRSRAAWEATDRDPGGLPRGAALTTARGWATDRAADLTDADRAYLRAAEAHERRRVRRLWSAIAVVSALALLAGSLAVVAGVRNNLAQQRLRTAESRNLADDSMRFRGIDPPGAI